MERVKTVLPQSWRRGVWPEYVEVHHPLDDEPRIYREADQDACELFSKTTIPPLYWPLLDAESVSQTFCCVCGSTGPLNQHHIVRRSQGRLYRHGEAVPLPTVTLCGSGNTSGCHGKAHSGRLHFRYEDRLEFLETEPMKYQDALGLDGWRPVRRDHEA